MQVCHEGKDHQCLVKSLEAAAIPATWVLESKDVPMSKLPWEVDAIIHASRS
ncbi:hypothetical protein V6Z12_A08G071900 [Gossypium hirsutum]